LRSDRQRSFCVPDMVEDVAEPHPIGCTDGLHTR
jgi:hypothetical protein